MNDFRTVQEYLKYQEEHAIPKLRWLEVKMLAEQFPNDQELGARVRILTTEL